MITADIESGRFSGLDRLDAWYFLSPGAAASRRIDQAHLAGMQIKPLGGPGGLAEVWAPQRFKRSYAAEGEEFIGYLRPHDLFRYLPVEVDRLSVKRSRNLDRYRVNRGMILQTCSGRNLGPSVIVDSHVARFALSHDLVRIEIDDERLRAYVSGFLQSPTGQGVLRRDKSGSVIDHISVGHVQQQDVPLLEDVVIDDVATRMTESFELVESAREQLSTALTDYEQTLPSPERERRTTDGWAVPFGGLTGRLDAASYDPWVACVQEELLAAGGVPLADVAEVRKPPGRYKTYYVGEGHGLPFLSGTQILQLEIINPQHMASKTFKDVSLYELREGWSVYQADGRAEEGLGFPAYVPPDRDGWVASGHVGRLIPKKGIDPGWLWLAAATWQAQAQIKSLASGSVVDSTYPEDMAGVVLPPPREADGSVREAWERFAEARAAKDWAITRLEEALTEASGIEKGTGSPLGGAAAGDQS